MPDAEFIQYEVTEDGDLLVITPGFWDVLKAHATADPPLTVVNGTVRIPLTEVPGTNEVTAQGNVVAAQVNLAPPTGNAAPGANVVAAALNLSVASGLQPRCELRIKKS